jgi:hypothetical protein
MSAADQAASVSNPNTAVNPSFSNSIKMAGMIPGFGPSTVIGALAGNLTGLSNNPFNPAGVQSFSPAQQQALNAALSAIANSNLPPGVKQAQMAAALAQARSSATGGANTPNQGFNPAAMQAGVDPIGKAIASGNYGSFASASPPGGGLSGGGAGNAGLGGGGGNYGGGSLGGGPGAMGAGGNPGGPPGSF